MFRLNGELNLLNGHPLKYCIQICQKGNDILHKIDITHLEFGTITTNANNISEKKNIETVNEDEDVFNHNIHRHTTPTNIGNTTASNYHLTTSNQIYSVSNGNNSVHSENLIENKDEISYAYNNNYKKNMDTEKFMRAKTFGKLFYIFT